jgi:preprotein translocase subunit YajC
MIAGLLYRPLDGGLEVLEYLCNLSGRICLMAEAAKDAPPAQQAEPTGGMAGMLLPIIAIFFLFYFILLRPQKREQARRQAMLDGIKKNDHVLTAGGIYGIVVNVHREAKEVTIKVDEATNTKLRMTLGSIAHVLGEEAADQSANKPQ